MRLKIRAVFCCAVLAVSIIEACILSTAKAQDLLGDNIGFSGATLHLKRYVNPGGANNLISMTTQPSNTGNNDLFVTNQFGQVYAVSETGGSVSSDLWFDYSSAIATAIGNESNGYVLEGPGGTHGGLRSVAFHPEFATNGKFYTSAMIDRPVGVGGINYLGPNNAGFDGESAVAEWTYDFGAGQVDSSSYRELFRVSMPVFDHPIKQIAFNNFAEPGDEDYGLLYITHGDGSVQSATAGGGQNTDDALGKILRINPLQDGANPYSTPGNPFNNTPGTLNEIYALGFRNPHQISFAKDANGDSQIIVSDTGRDNVEEIDVIQAGGDYGWSDREGTFVHNAGGGYGLGIGVSNLPANEWQLNDYVYPAAQYDHDANLGAGFVGSVVTGGFTIQNNSDPMLQGEYIFADFGSKSGHVYQASLTDLLGAHTQLADGESPTALTQAPISRLMLTLDIDGDGSIDRAADNLNTLLQKNRNDVRFGRGPNGEMFISSKQTGEVYIVTNTIPEDLLTLNVNRTTGEITISNESDVDVSIDGLSIQSASGALVPENLQTLANGWSLSPANTSSSLVQLNEDGEQLFSDNSPLSLGNIYDPSQVGFAQGDVEDLDFTYTGPGDVSRSGKLVYTGESADPNTLVLTVNLATGEATISNPTIFDTEVEAYVIDSASGSLNVAGWSSWEDQAIDDGTWVEGQASALRLLEAQEGGVTDFNSLASFGLGQIFSGGDQDFTLRFLLANTSELLDGVVVFELPGDFNNDNSVDGADFLAWQRDPNIGDLSDWQTNYGVSVQASLSSIAVPEPTSLALLAIVVIGCPADRLRCCR